MVENTSHNQTQDVPKQGIFIKMLLYLSGANSHIIYRKECEIEQDKFVGIGLVVLSTGFLASLSSGYALFIIFGSLPVATLLGGFWGFFIATIDRLLLLSNKRKKKNLLSIFFIVTRLCITSLASLIISFPVKVSIFNSEIQSQIKLDKIHQLEDKHKLLDQQKNKLNTKADAQEKIANDEAEGKSPTKRVGAGDIWKRKIKVADKKWNEVKDKETEIKKVKLEIEQLKASNQVFKVGFFKQLSILEKMANEDPLMKQSTQLIILIFLLIDAAPVMAKLLYPYSVYDAILERELEVATHRNYAEMEDENKAIDAEISQRANFRESINEWINSKVNNPAQNQDLEKDMEEILNNQPFNLNDFSNSIPNNTNNSRVKTSQK